MYLVSVSRQCIASVYRVSANIRDFKSVSFTPHPSVFDGLETAPSAPSGVNVARGVARDVGRMRQYEHLTGVESSPLFYISHNLSVEMGNFTDNGNTLNALHSDNLKNLSHTTKNKLMLHVQEQEVIFILFHYRSLRNTRRNNSLGESFLE